MIFHTLTIGDLPPDLMMRFEAMREALTRVPDPTGNRGTLFTTTESMDDDEARRWLEEVFSLYKLVLASQARANQDADFLKSCGIEPLNGDKPC